MFLSLLLFSVKLGIFLFNSLGFEGIGKWVWRKEGFFRGRWVFLVEIEGNWEMGMRKGWIFVLLWVEAKWGNWGLVSIFAVGIGVGN